MLSQNNQNFYIKKKKPFIENDFIKPIYLKEVYDFSFDMTLGKKGEHRNHRSGGKILRKKPQLFINTFQGKLAEFGIFDFFLKNELKMEKPDLTKWELGKWDTTDLIFLEKKINIKSTKFFGNLLLFETKDWTKDGLYIPNIDIDGGEYNYFILIRIKPNSDKLYEKIIDLDKQSNFKDNLENYIKNIRWYYDIPGFMTLVTMKYIIKEKRILPQNSMLNGQIKMDAENYYIESGDLKPIEFLIDELKNL